MVVETEIIALSPGEMDSAKENLSGKLGGNEEYNVETIKMNDVVAQNGEKTGGRRASRVRQNYKTVLERTKQSAVAMKYKARHINGRSESSNVAKYKAKVAKAAGKGNTGRATKQSVNSLQLKNNKKTSDELQESRPKKDISENGLAKGVKPEYIQWSVDAMRKVKAQKQQPNLERICRCVQREHAITDEMVENCLIEAALQGRLVTQCTPDGVMTYREAASRNLKAFARRRRRLLPNGSQPSRKVLFVKATVKLTGIIVKILRRECRNEEGKGLSLKRLIRYLRKTYRLKVEEGVDLKRSVRLGLKRAIKKHKVAKEGCLYLPVSNHATKLLNTEIEEDIGQNFMSLIKNVRLKTVSLF